MLKDGKYASWFKTPLGEGTGIVHVLEGRIWGGDSITSYDGSCQVDGDRFTATVRTKRHSAGHATVFGIDEVELTVTGTSNGKIATCSGVVKELPGVVFEATLIWSQDQPPAPEMERPAWKFDPSKLPKLPPRTRGK